MTEVIRPCRVQRLGKDVLVQVPGATEQNREDRYLDANQGHSYWWTNTLLDDLLTDQDVLTIVVIRVWLIDS